jgi:hypothetical protein
MFRTYTIQQADVSHLELHTEEKNNSFTDLAHLPEVNRQAASAAVAFTELESKEDNFS